MYDCRFVSCTRKVDIRLPGKGNSNSHGARLVHLIITMIKWIRTRTAQPHSTAGSFARATYLCSTQLQALGPSRTCIESIVEMGPARNCRTSGKEVRNIQITFLAFCAILRVVDYITGFSVMPKIA